MIITVTANPLTDTFDKEKKKKMSENKKQVSFAGDISLRAIHQDNEEVIKVLDYLEECMRCVREPESIENQTPAQKVEELVESVKRTQLVMNNFISALPVTRSDAHIRMYETLSVTLNRDLEKLFGLVDILAKHLSS